MRRIQNFQTIRSEGGLLPPDLLRRVIDPKEKLEGTRSEDYGLPQAERLNEVITQSWNRLRKHWAEFRIAAASLPEGEPGTGLTNDKWSLPLLRELSFGLLPTTPSPEINGRSYAISRFLGAVLVHLVGCGVSLDRRAAGVRGAAAANPHGLVQEFLNRSSGHLWAIVSNGLCLRILRDNQALSRQSFLEFDLETMFSGEVYSDFVLLWLMAHATRFAPREGERPETCWLEQWTKLAQEQGARALGDLRGGVEKALQILGEGFTSHPKNTALRDALRTGMLAPTDFHGQLLRIIYRLIFLFVAEDRILDGLPLLHPRNESDDARLGRERYAAHYGTVRLRELASKIKGSRHGDLWRQLQLLVNALSGGAAFENIRKHLALPALGSFLWNPANTAALNDAELTNHDFLESLRNLAFTRQGKVLRPVDYRNLGAEELGGVYESLLALSPQISADGARFTFAEFAGSERKTSGSYYTPDSLVQCLLDSALDPVVEEAIKGKAGSEAENAILALKICDPAVGSGHFLVGAAHRLARHLSRIRAHAQGESEPSPLLYQHALRDVIGHCLYGVDINPMAAELCRVSLWLEALEPGKPLSFLDHHIRVGNSLLGTTPELLANGIPDEAFTAIEGDDKSFASALKRLNKTERNQMSLPLAAEGESIYGDLADRVTYLDSLDDSSIGSVHEKEATYERLNASEEYRHAKLLADAWCSAFVWKKRKDAPQAVTEDILRRLRNAQSSIAFQTIAEINRISHQYQFFHWYLAFPEAFAMGGFDCVLGNPPWERVKIQDKEWFAERNPEIANAPNAAARKRLINALKADDIKLYQQFLNDSRTAEGESHFLRNSGRYPLCGRGDINVYSVFAEAMRGLISDNGRVGCVLPTGIATDDTTKLFFQDLISSQSLRNLYDFQSGPGYFGSIAHGTFKFCLLTLGYDGSEPAFAFFLRDVAHLADNNRLFTLAAQDIQLLNPNTGTCPIFRNRLDAEITKAIYRRVPILIREGALAQNPWDVRFLRMLDMANDSHLFRTRDQLEHEGLRLIGNHMVGGVERWLPLYEAKMIDTFDHRHGSYEEEPQDKRSHMLPENDVVRLDDPLYATTPYYWVIDQEVGSRLRKVEWKRNWLIGWRDVTDATNSARTVVSSVLPRGAVSGKFPLLLPVEGRVVGLAANLSAFVFDYASRQKIGSKSLSMFIVRQLPILSPQTYDRPCCWSAPNNLAAWIGPRVLDLTYTSWDLESFAKDCGWPGPPFRWDEERRFLLRCELDAAFFHLYLPADGNGDWRPASKSDGCPYDETPPQMAELRKHFPTPRDAVSYIMDTFPIVRRKDEEKYTGDYRTKRIILEIYDAMQESIRTGQPYQTRLDPPPADPRCCHPPKEHS
jgi:hypothetical protein